MVLKKSWADCTIAAKLLKHLAEIHSPIVGGETEGQIAEGENAFHGNISAMLADDCAASGLIWSAGVRIIRSA